MSDHDAYDARRPTTAKVLAPTSPCQDPDAEYISAPAATARKRQLHAISDDSTSHSAPPDEAPPDLPPAFYPAVPLLPSSEDLAFLAGLPTPCVRQWVDPHAPASHATAHPAPAGEPRTPSPPAPPPPVHAGLDAPLASPPPSAPRRPSASPSPALPPPLPASSGTKRAAPSDPSSTPPASPRPAPGLPDDGGTLHPPLLVPPHPPHPPLLAPALGTEALSAEDYGVPDPFGAILACHRRLWTGTTARGVPLRRSDTWADGRGWRRHVRVIRGVAPGPAAAVAAPPPAPGTPPGPGGAAEVEVGPGLDRQGTW